MDTAASIPYRERNSITARMPKIRAYSSAISAAFFGVMPRTSARRWGSFSMMVRVSSPKASTIRRAKAGPIPRIAPPERYLRIAPEVAGMVRSITAALNWVP